MQAPSFMKRCLATALALVFLATELLAVSGMPQLPDPGRAGISRDEQIQLGQKAVGEVYQQMPVLPDSDPIVQYVRQLGSRLDTAIPSQYNWPYQFHVVQQKEVNAFAIPGGPIFINVGTINAADNEAELAGVMAHEMSHVYMQHSAKAMQKQGLTQGIAQVLGGVLGSMIGGTAGALAQAGFQMGGQMLSMKYSRADEAQADAVGAIVMYRAGYDPKQMAAFFEKLEKESGPGGPQFLSDHPNPGNRYASIENEVKDWPARRYLPTSADFVSVKQRAAGVKAYSAQQIADGAKTGQWAQQNQRGGSSSPGPANASASQPAAGSGSLASVTLAQVRPSGNYTQEDNNIFSMTYPDNWRSVPDPNGGGLTIAPPAGVSGDAVAYGVVIGGVQAAGAGSLDSATQGLLQNLEQSQGMRAEGRPETIRVNGAEARSVYLAGTSPAQQNGKALAERDWLVTVQRADGSAIFLVFVAPQPEFASMQSTYEHMLRSLRMK